MSIKIRRFELKDGSAAVSPDGEYIHVNDITLALSSKKDDYAKMSDYLRASGDEKHAFAYEMASGKTAEILDQIVGKGVVS